MPVYVSNSVPDIQCNNSDTMCVQLGRTHRHLVIIYKNFPYSITPNSALYWAMKTEKEDLYPF